MVVLLLAAHSVQLADDGTCADGTCADRTCANVVTGTCTNGSPARFRAVVSIGTRGLFLHCSGSGSPTVVLEAGLGAGHSSWRAVQAALVTKTRVCSYDRAGLGQSDIAPTPRTSAEVVDDLHALLAAAAVAPPYVLAGHSFGALHARLYTARYPDTVQGLVLLDPVHEDWWREAAAVLPAPTADESQRLTVFRSYLERDVGDPALNAEQFDIPGSAALLRASGDLGERPLIVVSAARRDILAPGLPRGLEDHLYALFQRTLPQRLLALSTDSTQVVAEQSGHNIPQEQPDLVVAAIGAVVDAVRAEP
ncbi:alpha/beta hydrolase [Candidatus Gracilibacteria bacterium]|nr:alpha/beta hydrolase [Candidatus Gracilibacteria bacterium]